MRNSLKTLLFMSLLSIFGCNKANPNAYKADPILIDYQGQLAATSSDLETLKKQAEESAKELRQSQPQKGQAAIHRKKLEETKERISKLEQQILFWKIRIESRAKEAQLEYLRAHESGKEWPDKDAVNSYAVQKRLRLTKLQWSQKDRIREMKAPEKPAGSADANSAGH